MKERLLGKTPEELKAIALEVGLPAFAGKQMAQWLYQKHCGNDQPVQAGQGSAGRTL